MTLPMNHSSGTIYVGEHLREPVGKMQFKKIIHKQVKRLYKNDFKNFNVINFLHNFVVAFARRKKKVNKMKLP